MKRILILLLAMLLTVPAAAAEPQADPWQRSEGDGSYITRCLDTPNLDTMSWAETQNLTARYTDTGEVIPLTSDAYSGNLLFVTVPAEDADRPMEVFSAEYSPYPDCSKESNGYVYDESPIGTLELAVRGVVQGTDAGTLSPERVLTRAEAVTFLTRLLSLEPAGDPDFADVTATDWFYNAVSAAKAAGLIDDGTDFQPDAQMTRTELTVMLYQAMELPGWTETLPEEDLESLVTDAADIPDWAREAYAALGAVGIGIFDYGEDDKAFANAMEPVTRGETVELLYQALRFLPCYPTRLAMELGFDEEMPVIDGSTSTKPYTDAVYGALFINYRNHPQYPQKHAKSYYSYERLINGEADILFASTKPTQDTLDKAEAAGVELELVPIAHDAMVFFTNRENTLDNLTMEQIAAIYTDNAYANWKELGGPDAALIPYCRNTDSGSQAQMEEFFLKGKEIHPDIRQETVSTSMASVLTDVQDAMTTDPPAYALGYSIYYYYQSASQILLYPEDSLKLLSVDGIMPNDQTIADQSYPLSGYNYAVVRADAEEGSLARQMVDFMLSDAGQDCVTNAGYGALVTTD